MKKRIDPNQEVDMCGRAWKDRDGVEHVCDHERGHRGACNCIGCEAVEMPTRRADGGHR